MKVLFIDTAFRTGSRTNALAQHYLKRYEAYETISLGEDHPQPLTGESLRVYNAAVASKDFSDEMFNTAKRFCEADEIVIAAPFWNYSIPAVLHDYLELVCTQGISFDMTPTGEYVGLCKAKKLTYVTTAGGPIPENDFAFGYIRKLCDAFWNIPEVRCYKADGIDVWGVDVEAKLREVMEQMDKE